MKSRSTLVALLLLAACADDGGNEGTSESSTTLPTTSASTSDTNETGDAGQTGDGDGDPATTTGDGDGDPTTTTTGDGDGDPSTSGVVFDMARIPDLPGNEGPNEMTCEQAAASLTSAGCLFAPIVGNPYSQCFMGPLPWAVIAANANFAPATVTLYDIDGNEIGSEVVAPGELHVFELAGNENAPMEHPSATGVFRSLRLESDIPIVAYQFQPYSSSTIATADAALLLPAHAWGDNYLNVNAKNDGNHWVTVVSLDDGVEVTVAAADYQTGSSAGGPGIPALGASQEHVEILDSQDTLRIYSQNADLTGMRIYSEGGDVAVYSGSPGMSLPGPGFQSYRDYLEIQLPPREAWGNEYAAVKFRPRTNEEDLYRIIADKDGTTINLTGDYVDSFNLDEGEFVEFSTAGNFLASSDDAFAIAHFIVSCSESTGNYDMAEYPGEFEATNNCSNSISASDMADPAVSFLVPTAQYRNRYTFLVPFTYAWDMITVTAPSAGWGDIELDGSPLPAPTELGVGDLSYARFLLDDGAHVIEAQDTPFGLEVYGYDCRISYAYPGGLSLGSINIPPAPEG